MDGSPEDVDDDNDGVSNLRDDCPVTTDGSRVDETGCSKKQVRENKRRREKEAKQRRGTEKRGRWRRGDRQDQAETVDNLGASPLSRSWVQSVLFETILSLVFAALVTKAWRFCCDVLHI